MMASTDAPDGDNNKDQPKLEDEQKISRRVFVQYSATMVGTSSLLGAVVLKTDALSQTIVPLGNGGENSPYTYLP
jgi:hypothetical protein